MRGTSSDVAAWFKDRLPAGWFTGPAVVLCDREEILVTGSLEEPDVAGTSDAAGRGGPRRRCETVPGPDP